MKIFAFTVTRAASPERAKLLQETLVQGRKRAGVKFDWHVWGSGCGPEGEMVLHSALCTDGIQGRYMRKDNIGQHMAWNEAYAAAVEGEYDYFLRIDDDCEFLTKRWLKKLVDASVLLDDEMILAPIVRGLEHPPIRSNKVETKGVELWFLRDAIGGICRLHPMKLLNHPDGPFVADVRKPLGSGDATGIADWAKSRVIPFAYINSVRVRHAKTTTAQRAADPQHFSEHDLYQHIPYIPDWRPVSDGPA